MGIRKRVSGLVLAAAAVVTLAGGRLALAESDGGESFVGHVVNLAGGPVGSARLYIHVDSWSTDDEVSRLARILAEQGPEALQSALEDLEKGYIRLGSSLGYPIAVARSFPREGGGRLVRVVIDRPLGFVESVRNLRTVEYPLAVVELVLDENGKGEGTMAPAVKAHFEGQQLVVETYGIQPARVLQITRR